MSSIGEESLIYGKVIYFKILFIRSLFTTGTLLVLGQRRKRKKVKNDEGPGTVLQLSVDLPIVLCDNSAHHVEDDLEVTNQYESFEQFIVFFSRREIGL